ncbi:MAG TPA: hypothetical protein VGM39_21560 [Kofleriaceae bacterium]|jgi:hypothetical protein
MRNGSMLVVALLLAAGCNRDVTSYLAIGWTGDPPRHCTGNFGAMEAVQRLPIGGLIAVKAGDTTLSCRDGNVTLRVVEPTALAIQSAGPIAKGAQVVLTGVLSADGHGLAVGDSSVTWKLPAGLRQAELCTQGSCIKPSSVRVVADAPGTYEISARWNALSATTTILVN